MTTPATLLRSGILRLTCCLQPTGNININLPDQTGLSCHILQFRARKIVCLIAFTTTPFWRNMVLVKRVCAPEKKGKSCKVWQITRTWISSDGSHKHHRFCHWHSWIVSCIRVATDCCCCCCDIRCTVWCLQKCCHFEFVLFASWSERSQSHTETCLQPTARVDC